MPDQQILDLLARGGAMATLAFGVIALWKEWLVPGSRYARMEAEKEEWKDMAIQLMRTADKAVNLVERP